jgi:Cof subfamily protein (haloacid dehalogenase superfamily)
LFKLIASDMDDTLLNAEGILTPRTLRALRRAMDAGVFVVLASGRMLESTLPFAEQLPVNAPLIVYNGAMVYDPKAGRAIEKRTVPMETARGICELAEKMGVYVQAYPGEGYFAAARTKYTGLYEDSVKVNCEITGVPLSKWISSSQVKLLAIGEREDTLKNIDKFRAAFPDVSFMMSRPNYIEIVSKGVDKKDALEKTIASLGIAPGEVLAFGDGQNDVSMLGFAGLGYCVENASEGVRAQCAHIAPANALDGCAIVIERLLDAGELRGA